MKKIFSILFLLFAFLTNAQNTMFGRHNNYVTPEITTPRTGIITTGMVLNLDAANSSSYSGTGTTWTDLSGRGNHGTLFNSVTYSPTNQGALVFNGNGNGNGSPNPYVNLPTTTDFNFGTGDFTLETWIYPQSFSNYLHMIALPDQNTFALKAEVTSGNIYYYNPRPSGH